MRLILASLALVLLAASASARPSPIGHHVDVTVPSDDCGDCVGVGAGAWTLPPDGCNDCDTVGAFAGVQHGDGETTASVAACKGGFVYFCVVDESVTV